MSTEFVQVSTATDSAEAAATLARSALSARLAAGAQILGPVRSIVWHLGELTEGEEWQILFRATASQYPDLEAHLIEHHPWSNPEVVAVPLWAVAEGYGDWLGRSVEAL
jgi:periplasmic divalent cation tolerance protein